MFIVAWNREDVVNVSNTIRISLERKTVITTTQEEQILLGSYRTRERAEEVFSEMLSTMFIPNLILVNGSVDGDELGKKFRDSNNIPWGVTISGDDVKIQPVTREIYYMPEE